jgi:hypothetical protein
MVMHGIFVVLEIMATPLRETIDDDWVSFAAAAERSNTHRIWCFEFSARTKNLFVFLGNVVLDGRNRVRCTLVLRTFPAQGMNPSSELPRLMSPALCHHSLPASVVEI